MTQPLKQPLPSLTAAHLAAFAAPDLQAAGVAFRWRKPDISGDVLYPQWWRHPAIVLRGWRPREVPARKAWRERIGAVIHAVVERLAEWRERARGRRLLLTLDERELKDIGIDPATARAEAELPFWRG